MDRICVKRKGHVFESSKRTQVRSKDCERPTWSKEEVRSLLRLVGKVLESQPKQ